MYQEYFKMPWFGLSLFPLGKLDHMVYSSHSSQANNQQFMSISIQSTVYCQKVPNTLSRVGKCREAQRSDILISSYYGAIFDATPDLLGRVLTYLYEYSLVNMNRLFQWLLLLCSVAYIRLVNIETRHISSVYEESLHATILEITYKMSKTFKVLINK